MAKKKSISTKKSVKKSLLNKIAGQVGHIAGEIVVGKDHLIEMAGEVIHSMKETVHNITTNEKAAPKSISKTAIKKTVSKRAQSTAKKVTNSIGSKKTALPKKAIKKAVKKEAKRK